MLHTILHNKLFIMLVLLAIDFFLGVYRAMRQDKYSSGIMRDGLVKNTLIFLGLSMLSVYAVDYHIPEFATVAVTAFALQTISSILENYIAIGGKIPPKIAQIFNSKVKEIDK